MLEISHTEFGIPDEIAVNIQSQFQPMLTKMVELETEFNEIIKLPIEDAETSKKAKELRWKYVKIRTGTDEIHKKQKAFYLNGCKFIDGWKNAQKFASQGKEEKLQFIENYIENVEKERKENLHKQRYEIIKPLFDKLPLSDVLLGDMDEDVWEAYYNAKKNTYNDIIQSELKAEEERKEKAILDALEMNRKLEVSRYAQFIKEEFDLRNANETQYKEYLSSLEVFFKEYELERVKLKADAENLKKANEEKEKQLAEERAKAELEKAALEKKIEEEKRAKAKIEAQIKLKEKEEKAALRKAKLASDRDKLEALAVQLESLSLPELKNEESEAIIKNVKVLMNKVCVYIREKANDL
jgi:colicin import membrane protein